MNVHPVQTNASEHLGSSAVSQTSKCLPWTEEVGLLDVTINARTEGVVKEAIKRGRVVKEVMRERHFDDSETDVGV